VKVLAIQTSPNTDGLTATIAASALEGAKSAGAEIELVHLKQLKIESCRQCENGWGRCRREGMCIIEDDLESVREKMRAADALVLSTPVYFGDVSEVTKNFLDRLRRCERHWPGESPIKGTPVLSIAAAGGGGGGGPTCLVALDRYFGVIGLPVFDSVIVTRRSRDYKIAAAKAAGAALVAWAKEQAK
jgi:multimeric flavodoxin WrbA